MFEEYQSLKVYFILFIIGVILGAGFKTAELSYSHERQNEMITQQEATLKYLKQIENS